MRCGTERFAAELRRVRKKRGLGLRELARQAGISSSFLSDVESGKEKPPAQEKIRALAKVLCCNEELLLAKAAELPRDVMKIIQKHPCEFFNLIRACKRFDAEELKAIPDGLPNRRKP